MSTKVQLENVSPTIGNTLLAVVHSFREAQKGIAEIQVVTPETAKKLRSLGFNGLSIDSSSRFTTSWELIPPSGGASIN